jgi:hypothetical protein
MIYTSKISHNEFIPYNNLYNKIQQIRFEILIVALAETLLIIVDVRLSLSCRSLLVQLTDLDINLDLKCLQFLQREPNVRMSTVIINIQAIVMAHKVIVRT